jgi:hypothetical protein
MDEKDGVDKLCNVYEKLDDEDKEKVIRMAEGLLNTQKNSNENYRTKLDNSRG